MYAKKITQTPTYICQKGNALYIEDIEQLLQDSHENVCDTLYFVMI